MLITIRRGGCLLELSAGGGRLPENLEVLLGEQMQYTHLHQLRGADAYDHLGNYQPTRVETKRLFQIDSAGRFICSVGFIYRVKHQIEAVGYRWELIDVDPPHPRPDRYETNWDLIFERMDLRVKQDEILAAMDGTEHGIIKVPAGVGKTFLIGAYALAKPHCRVHVITDGLDILDRIYRHLTKFLPNVGMVGGGSCRFGPHITVLSADSLRKVGDGFDNPNSPLAADTVIFDEVHKAAAPSILESLIRYKRCRMYGLSASPKGRFDNAEAQLEGLFGNIVYEMTDQEAVELGLIMQVEVEWITMDFPHKASEGKRGLALDRWGLWRNRERNQKIAERLLQVPQDTQVLLMVDKVEHAVNLKQSLPHYKLCYGTCKDYASYIESGLLDPRDETPMTPARRDRMRKEFESGDLRHVIATDVWSTGVDFTALGVVCRADGRSSPLLDTQIPGRGNRIHEGKERSLLIECMDMFNDTLLGRSNSRKRQYIAKGYPQIGLARKRVGVRTAAQNR